MFLHALLQHIVGPAPVMLQIQIGGVLIAGLFQRMVDGIDILFEVEVIF